MIFNVGGDTRAETVRNGVQTLMEKRLADNHDNILVHDAARCCLPQDALSRLIQEAGTKAEGGIFGYSRSRHHQTFRYRPDKS